MNCNHQDTGEPSAALPPLKLCSTCHKRPRKVGPRITQCRECRAVSAKNGAAKCSSARREAGLCQVCGSKAITGRTRCTECATKRIGEGRSKRLETKTKAVAYKGGKCLDCGLVSVYLSVYDFHHTDPKTKDFNVGNYLAVPWEEVKPELDKCDLLCSNCHRIRHEQYSYGRRM